MESYIECKCCGKKFKRITQTHLKKHNMTPSEYLSQYGELCSYYSSQKQSKSSIQSQFDRIVSWLEKMGFEALFNIDSYKGIFEPHTLKCYSCNNIFSSKLNDKRRVICRQCNPYKKKKEIEFKYVDILDDFRVIKTEKEKEVCGVYAIKNTKTGKFYIGSSKQIRHRWTEHKTSLNNRVHINKRLQNSWNKHNQQSFELLILSTCSIESLLSEEQKYLDLLKPYDRNIGYNLNSKANGGDFYSLLSESEKLKFKEKCKRAGQNNGMFGKKHANLTKEKMKKSAKGRFTEEWFINRCGEKIGKIKYRERCTFLANR